MMLYCDYCSYGYISVRCSICGRENLVCACDGLDGICEEHYCISCLEPFIELDEDGVCKDCRDESRLGNLSVKITPDKGILSERECADYLAENYTLEYLRECQDSLQENTG